MKNRKQLVEIIAGLLPGRTYDDCPAHWDVSIHYPIDGFDGLLKLWEERAEKDYSDIAPENRAALLAIARNKYSESIGLSLEDNAKEDMARGILGPNMLDGYRTCTPEVFKRFDITGDPYFVVKFDLRGRSGKHLCLVEFEGVQVMGAREDLLSDCGIDDETSIEWLNKFAAYLTECKTMFSSERVNDDFAYEMASFFNAWLERLADEHKDAIAAERHIAKWLEFFDAGQSFVTCAQNVLHNFGDEGYKVAQMGYLVAAKQRFDALQLARVA